MTSFLLVTVGLLGLVLGSFLNVVIYRVPAGLSVVRPPSACPSCDTEIRPYDNIPVISWVLLRGRCRVCHQGISARYPLVEVTTSVLFVLVGLRFGWSWTLPSELIFVAALLALAFCDFDQLILPKRIVWPATGLVAAAMLTAAVAQGSWKRLAIAAACGLVEFGLFFAVNVINSRWLGFGDVRLALLLGLGLGWVGPGAVLVGLILANVLGVVVGIGLIIAGRASRQSKFPFGVFLAFGATVAVIVVQGGAGGLVLR